MNFRPIILFLPPLPPCPQRSKFAPGRVSIVQKGASLHPYNRPCNRKNPVIPIWRNHLTSHVSIRGWHVIRCQPGAPNAFCCPGGRDHSAPGSICRPTIQKVAGLSSRAPELHFFITLWWLFHRPPPGNKLFWAPSDLGLTSTVIRCPRDHNADVGVLSNDCPELAGLIDRWPIDDGSVGISDGIFG
jgi:hypothetical protein